MKKQAGFTLIELVVVIVILGILAATAAPKFMDLQSDARISALNGLKGAISSAVAMTYSKAILAGYDKYAAPSYKYICATGAATSDCANGTADAPGTTRIYLAYGKPTSTVLQESKFNHPGIINALDLDIKASTSTDITATDWVYNISGTGIYIYPNNKTTTCAVKYTQPSAEGVSPTIEVITTGC